MRQALASGLYVLSSKYAGASHDLIKKGINGDVFNPNNVEEIASVVKRTIANILDIRKRRGDISKQAREDFSIEKSAKVFINCIQSIYRLKSNE